MEAQETPNLLANDRYVYLLPVCFKNYGGISLKVKHEAVAFGKWDQYPYFSPIKL